MATEVVNYNIFVQTAPLSVSSTLSLDQEEEDSMHEKYFLSGNTQLSSGRRSVESTPQVTISLLRGPRLPDISGSG